MVCKLARGLKGDKKLFHICVNSRRLCKEDVGPDLKWWRTGCFSDGGHIKMWMLGPSLSLSLLMESPGPSPYTQGLGHSSYKHWKEDAGRDPQPGRRKSVGGAETVMVEYLLQTYWDMSSIDYFWLCFSYPVPEILSSAFPMFPVTPWHK